MSEEGGFGITAAEKFFGIILVIVGALTTHFTLTSSNTLGIYTWFFGFLAMILLALGIFLIIVKAE
ncbi:MAG: hypothetical protein QW161_01440 [Candidatus Bathyarchaeia archaeon]